jgi:hypothetical protein
VNLIGELIEMIARRAGLDNVGDVGYSLKKRPRDRSDDNPDPPTGRSSDEQVRDLLDVIGSDLLDFGQLIIAGMKMTTGDGEPEDGLVFRDGHRSFDKAGETLRSAVPDDRWGGAGSRAYADQNTRQQVRSEAMADADEAVVSVLVREAIQIKARRNTLDDQADLLAKTSYATFPLQFIPRYGEAAKLAIEGGALQGALQVCAYALYQLHSEVSANATELRQALGRYAAVADGAHAPGDGVDFNPPEPPSGGEPPSPAPARPPLPPGVGPGGGGASGGGAAMPGAQPPDASIGGPAPQLDLPQPVLPAGPPASTSAPAAAAAPAAMTGMPAAGGAAGALASVVGPLAGLVTGIALAAGQAAAAGQRAQGDDADDEDVGEDTGTAGEVRDGDPGDQVATAGPGHGAAERAPVGAEVEPDTKGGEGIHVGG